MAKTQFGGLHSPGPIYDMAGVDRFKYSKDQQAVIGKYPRKTFEETHFDYFDRKDVDFEPGQADLGKRTRHPTVRFGL
jgi:hypothetical protein